MRIKNQNSRFTGIEISISQIMTNMTDTDPDIVYFRPSEPLHFALLIIDLIIILHYMSQFMIYIVSMLHSNLSN